MRKFFNYFITFLPSHQRRISPLRMELMQLAGNIFLIRQIGHTEPHRVRMQHLHSKGVAVHEAVDLHRQDAFLLQRVALAGLEEGVGFRTVFDSGVEPDHNFLIAERPDGICRKAAEVTSAKTGITLTVSGDGCGVQWYACGGLSAAAVGKGGKGYCRHGGFCLEMQDYVDAPNRPEYPSIRLEPGEVYSRCIRYAFDNSEK